ncbi:hypothetical protein ACTMSW_18075 [Micromonospora sp. BQ11]|uniref:hypothetical protein n=1 Tax=Micromonospora sp. BQ11 TaxID=3452212 RepID=UPI003F8C3EBC
MPAAAVLALLLAFAPAPTPTGSTGPVGDLLGGVGDLVDDLLPTGADDTPAPSPTPSVRSPAANPSDPSPPLPGPARPTPGATGGPSSVATDAVRRGAAVPARPVATAGTPDSRAAPPAGSDRGGDRQMAYAAGTGVLAVGALVVLWRRRRAVPTPAVTPTGAGGPTGPSSGVPQPDDDPTPENVTRLPTGLNDIYELGRLDERLRQRRDPDT